MIYMIHCISTMRILTSLPALAALLLAITTIVSAQEVTAQIVCAQQGINDCAALNRLCRVVDNGRETCPVCLEGYIGFLREDLINSECILISSIDLDKLGKFIQEYGAEFKQRVSQVTPEERLQLFIKMADFISQHNAQEPPPSYELGLTPWSTDTEADGRERAGFIFVPTDGTEDELPPVPEATSVNAQQGSQLPDRVDWVEEGAVTFVKDQGRCGCCWAVSVSGAIEGAAAINAKQNGYEYVQSLSFQQLISCADKNYGCGGGDLVLAMKYALLNEYGGIAQSNDYSYTDYQGSTTKECKVEEHPLAVIPEGGQVVLDFFDASLSFQERLLQMKTTLAKQPISSVIRSNCGTLSSYKKGILTDDGDCACDNPSCIDHAILLVGYDDTSDPPYFKLKNSWGTSWGEDGYFRIAQSPANGAYGLFGMLSHGVIPDIAYNVTLQVEDEEPDTLLTEVPWWASFLILLAAVCCCCGCMAVVKNKMDAKKRAAKRQRIKSEPHKKRREHHHHHNHDEDEDEEHKQEEAAPEEAP
jgi:C1A family cysteine protease